MKPLSESRASVSTELPSSATAKSQRRPGDKWLLLLAAFLFVWTALPWLAPVFMQLGWESLAKPIYLIYSFQCHQLPQRSFFLFGPQPMISLSEVQAVWQDTTNPAILRQFIGNARVGYKVGWSDRMVAAYSSVLLGGAVWYLLRKRLRFFPLWGVVLLALPMAVDGFSHMASDLAGIGEGFRYTNQWLAELTQYRLPQSFYEGTTIGTFNSSMRLITGVLFGVGIGWFTFSHLGAELTSPKRTRTDREVVSQSEL
ncbi:MAG: hypothetical protein BMS9Abin28_1640 [Anaerolineae bacterium]|nr:MAG: hypothetical protein BMS9Abin28_1640 [Anaerolineae bacterium]